MDAVGSMPDEERVKLLASEGFLGDFVVGTLDDGCRMENDSEDMSDGILRSVRLLHCY